jgi:hypothetical protein
VSPSLSLCSIWCCSCCRCATYGVTMTVIVQHVVSLSLSLCYMWQCGHCHCAIYGVAVGGRGQLCICQQGRWKVGEHYTVRWKREKKTIYTCSA